MKQTCPGCGGKGKYEGFTHHSDEDPCSQCGGSGILTKKKPFVMSSPGLYTGPNSVYGWSKALYETFKNKPGDLKIGVFMKGKETWFRPMGDENAKHILPEEEISRGHGPRTLLRWFEDKALRKRFIKRLGEDDLPNDVETILRN